MSLDAFRDTRTHRQRMLWGVGLAAIMCVAIVVLLILILLTLQRTAEISIEILNKPEPPPPPTMSSRWIPDYHCLYSAMTFVRSSAQYCERIKDGTRAKCDWNFMTQEGTPLPTLLHSLSTNDHGFYSIVLYSGHDSVRIRPGSRLDSNFDLASQRGLTVADAISSLAKDENTLIPPPVVVTSSHAEKICKKTQPDNESSVRRSPVIQITHWTQQP